MTALFVLARTVHFASAMLLFALPYAILVIFRPAFAGGSYSFFCRGMQRGLAIALGLEAASGGLWFWIEAAQRPGRSPWRSPSPSVLGFELLHTPFGHLWLLRAGLGAILAIALGLALRRNTLLPPRPSPLNATIMLASASLLLSLAWASRAAIGFRHQVLHLLADAPHLLLAAIWPMGLIPMACFLWEINRGKERRPLRLEVETLQRFSRTALAAVLILVVTGTINAWLMIGSWNSLFMTTHGRLFLCKMAVVVIMIGIGAYCRLRLVPEVKDVSRMFRVLEKAIWAESGLAFVVILIVGMHV